MHANMSSSNRDQSVSQRQDLSQTTTNPSALNDFSRYVGLKKTSGINGYGKSDDYVSIRALKEYWNKSSVGNILHSFNPPINVDIDDIIKRYLRTFSILVYINRVPYIRHFMQYDYDDEKGLPYNETMSFGLPKSDETCKVWENILKNQWIFCPFQFGPKKIYLRPLDQRCILPIDVIRQLTPDTLDEEAAVVQVVKLHPDYDRLLPATTRQIVFKKYGSQRSRELWENEVGIFTSIKGQGACDQIVEYYGSFSQGETFTTMLEYADKGTLLDVMRSSTPLEREELFRLWLNLADLFKGLIRIHGLENPDPQKGKRTYVLRTIHLDIKPANILVFQGATDSPFDFRFKLADFSSSHIRKAFAWGPDTKGSETGGTQMYSAVECCRDFRFLTNENFHISQNVDIWSLGCVFSEVLVWTTMGQRGLERYRIKRKEATDKVPSIRGSGYDGCFHDSEKTLDCVKEMHEEAKLNRTRWDETLTPSISDLILDNMLRTEAGGRLEAIHLYRRFEEKLEPSQQLDGASAAKKGKENDIHHGESGESANPMADQEDWNGTGVADQPRLNGATVAPDTSTRPSAQKGGEKSKTWGGGSSTSTLHPLQKRNHEALQQPPQVSKSEVQSGDELQQQPQPEPIQQGPSSSSKAIQPSFPSVTVDQVISWREAKKKGTPIDLPGLRDVLGQLEGRDHLFVLDDSTSMRPSWGRVEKLFQALAYVVKAADPDGLELYFTSEHSRPHKNKNSGPLVELIKKRPWSGLTGICNMRLCLDHIVEKVVASNIQGKQTSGWPSKLGRSNPSPSRPISIYILTNGTWDSPGESLYGTDKAIMRLIKALEASGKSVSHVALQFIRFGEDGNGKWRLDQLDDMAKHSPDTVTMDIVDHTSQNGNVWKMLIGSLSEGMDND